MSLTKTDLANIAQIIERKLDYKLDEKLAPMYGEIAALRSDVVEIYEMIIPRWKKIFSALRPHGSEA